MRAEYYADEYRRYATYCRDFGDNKLFKIACGPNSRDYRWAETLMKQIPARQMQGLALHYYTVPGPWHDKGSATDFTEEEWFSTLRKALFMEELIRKHSAIMDKHDPKKKVALVVDEWGTWYNIEPGTNPGFLFQQNSLRDALVAGITLNIFNNHCDRVRMANIAQTVNVLQAMILTKGEKMILTPTYHVFEMYKVHQDATLLPVDLSCTDYKYGKEAIPTVSASASRDSDGKVHISLCNLDPEREIAMACEVRDMTAETVTGRILTAKHIYAHNTFAQPESVKPSPFTDARLEKDRVSVKLPPKAVMVLELS